MKPICPKCEKSELGWHPDREGILKSGIMECTNPECTAQFVEIGEWKEAVEKEMENDWYREGVRFVG